MKSFFNFDKIKIPKLIRIDPFGKILFVKRAIIGVVAMYTYRRFNILNKLKIEGMEHLKDLPDTNVLFISNHQTYYADVMALYHVFATVKWKMKNTKNPLYTLIPRVKSYYIAAEETMFKSGLLPKIFAYAGAITVKRAWRSGGQDIKGNSDIKAPEKIQKALKYGWVVNFPQGTTTPFAPVRKGTASMIKSYKPIVVPVVIDGFNTAFDKKGLKLVNKGTQLSVRFKKPMVFEEGMTVEEIHKQIAALIEQVPPPKAENKTSEVE